MQIFATTLFIIFFFLVSVVNCSEKNCLNQYEKCSLWMVWPRGSPGLKAGTMALPKELILYDKNCAVLETKMEQPEKKGPIMIKSSLPDLLTITGEDATRIEKKPMFTYGNNKEGKDHCGAGSGDDWYDWVCTFSC
ncbi:hypothetical protein OCU04_009726 [Sclerotinia nivalis]|uniref:Uncharacterized protein n=1 Tax=Sclerotinia nivalis TaxID=352851 RepID=A0A9X0AFN3_9HELO|nr:hypothetical protein OCU04_009726 [Sclerotinia nivalis]